MKVIKEGKLPEIKKRTLRGTCTNCGCIVEEDYEFLVTIVIPTVACPTNGCNKPIFMMHKYQENLSRVELCVNNLVYIVELLKILLKKEDSLLVIG